MIRCWLGGTLVGALLAGAPLAAPAASLAEFAGVWTGVEVQPVDGDPPFELTPAHLSVRIAQDRDGFRISWHPPGRQPVEAAFAPTDRPGVFFVRPDRGPLFGLFSSPATGNPLQGETLLWSRLEGETLVVYSLSLGRDGGFDLHRYAWTVADQRTMTLDFSWLAEGPTEVRFSGRLERTEG